MVSTKLNNVCPKYQILISNNTYIYSIIYNKLLKQYYYNLVLNIVIRGYIYQFSENRKIIIYILIHFSTAQRPYGHLY